MATGAQNAWSTTPATNASADTGINGAEGQAPSTLNDAIRGVMAGVAKLIKDWRGGLVTGGTSTAYTLTTNEGLTLADGVKVSARLNATNGAAPTLDVDSTGAVAIHTVAGTAIPVGALFNGGVYEFTYYASGPAWVVHGAFGQGSRYVGEVFDFAGASAPALCLFCYGQAVSRTTYAALFAIIGTTYGVGDGSTTFNVPDLRGRVVAGQDDMGGSSANRLTNVSGGLDGDTLGAAGGAESHALTEAQLASHAHAAGSLATDTAAAHGHPFRLCTASSQDNDSSGGIMVAVSSTTDYAAYTGSPTSTAGQEIGGGGAHSHAVTGSSASTGSGTAHNNVQPTLILNKCIYAGA
jgi:microcystin-dependent protein